MPLSCSLRLAPLMQMQPHLQLQHRCWMKRETVSIQQLHLQGGVEGGDGGATAAWLA